MVEWVFKLDDSKFESRVRVHRDIFEFILGEISPFITKKRTNFVPIPIELHPQYGRAMDIRNEYKEEEVTVLG